MQRRLADSRVKFRHLQCFLAVAQFGGVQKAAESLSITQPAVSKTVAELEAILGVKLFERGRHGAAITREGQLFVPHASACVSALRQGVDLLTREGGGATASLEIGMLPTIAPALVPPMLARFAKDWPQVVVRLVTSSNAELLERLKAGTIEFAIGRLADPEKMIGLNFEQLFNEPLAVVVRAGHPLASSASSAASPAALPAALAGPFPVVLPPFGTLIRQSAESLLTMSGAAPLASFVEVLSVSVGRALALENDALWFVPLAAVERDLDDGALVRLPLPYAGTEEPVGLIRRTDSEPSPVARTLIEAVRGVARRRLAAQASPPRGKPGRRGRRDPGIL
ncbi:pca operon transcription factor PcaQ [Trinickia mobilis]|uniref:pca operon transcription factor PcaQ n=1 Tax=Trinickia mobilis TaxID=2816356 RepID=UPI001A8FE2D6|nr:pca operon transcription factor PcaQ [Trinickia mobilis]